MNGLPGDRAGHRGRAGHRRRARWPGRPSPVPSSTGTRPARRLPGRRVRPRAGHGGAAGRGLAAQADLRGRCRDRDAVRDRRDRGRRGGAGQPGQRPRPGGEQDRSRGVPHLAAGDRLPQPGDRGPRLRAQRAAHLPGPVHRRPRPGAAGGQRPAPPAHRHPGRPGRPHPGDRPGGHVAGRLRPAHHQPGAGHREARHRRHRQPGKGRLRPAARRAEQPAGGPGPRAEARRLRAEQFRDGAQRDLPRHRARAAGHPDRARVQPRDIGDPAAVPACRRRPPGGRR